MKPLLHFGSAGRNGGGRTVADDSAGGWRILSGVECGACSSRGGDTLCLDTGRPVQLRTRSAGGQPAINGRVETAQAEE